MKECKGSGVGRDIDIGPKSGIECLTLVLLEVMGRELQNAETPGVVHTLAMLQRAGTGHTSVFGTKRG